MTQPVFLEVQDKHAFADISTGNLDSVNIFPARLVQRVINNRITQDKANLALGHTRLEFVYHRLRSDVSLLDRNTMYAWEPECRTTAGQQHYCKKYNCFHLCRLKGTSPLIGYNSDGDTDQPASYSLNFDCS